MALNVGLPNMGGKDIPPNTVLRAYETVLLCLTRLKKGEDSVPVRQNPARLSLRVESLEKLVNGLSHGNWGEFASIVRCSSQAAKLDVMSSVAGEGMRWSGSHFQA